MAQKLHRHFRTLIWTSLGLGIWLIHSCQRQNPWQGKYPTLAKIPAEERYHGVTVVDAQAQLNDLDDQKVQQWFRAQDSLTEKYFANNGSVASYLDHFKALESREASGIGLVRTSENGEYFFLRYGDAPGTDAVYVQKQWQEESKRLFRASDYGNGQWEVTYLEPSYDGRLLAIGLHRDAEFASEVVIVDVANGSLLPERIVNINPDFGGLEWLPDGSGCIYLYFPVVDKGVEGYKQGSYSVLHHWGKAPMPIFGKQQGLDIPDDYYPKVKIRSSLDQYAIGYTASSSNFYDAYFTKMSDVLAGRPNWRPFFKEAHQIFYNQGEQRGEEFVYRQATDTGNRLCSVSLENPDFGHPKVLAEGTIDNPISRFELTRDHVYYTQEKYGVEVSLFRLDNTGGLEQLSPPFRPGYADFFGNSVVHDAIGVTMDGWTAPTLRYRISPDGRFEVLPFDTSANYPEFNELVSEQVMVPSHDGEEVPLSLVYRKDLDKNGKNKIFAYVYGAYGDNMSPFFFPMFLDWAAQGGVLAFPHVRGGGEKGPTWHQQGSKTLKHNSWRDAIACMEYLVDEGYTSKGGIALYTNSAGGITAGMAINEEPELFGALIAEFPRLNPLGLEAARSASSTSYLEYGSVKDSLEFEGLLAMDPYHNLSEQGNYPPTLILTSYNDDRIPLWDNGKYVAQRQVFENTDGPVFMDINYDLGHGHSADYEESVILHAKIFGFAHTFLK